MKKTKLLIISLDSLSEEDMKMMLKMQNFKKLAQSGTLVTSVKTIFPTNTYPIHTSIITGNKPEKNGIKDNLIFDPGNPKPDWHWYRKEIKTTTLYDEAKKNKLTTASILWPVTAKAKIKYNLPEIFPHRKWQNQIIVSIINGSIMMQLTGYIKYGKNINGKQQPALDDFTTNLMADTIRNKKPDLALLHLIEVDSNKHKYGNKSLRTIEAIKRMDERIGQLIKAINDTNDKYSLIIFSDHGSLPVEKTINPNQFLKELGIRTPEKKGDKKWEAWFRTAGGTAYLYTKNQPSNLINKVKEKLTSHINQRAGLVRRFLTDEEMQESGFSKEAILGIEAERGVEFRIDGSHFKANHGYSIMNDGYDVFYLIKGENIKKNKILTGGSLLDITPIACKLLKIYPWEMDGTLRKDIWVRGDERDE